MNIEIGDIIIAHDKMLLVVHDPFDEERNEYPFILINLNNFEVNNAYPSLEAIGKSFKIDRLMKSYQITLSK
jgi:hypothetical protein